MKNFFLSRFLKIAALLLVVSYAAYQLYASVYNPLVTETAVHYTGYDGFTIEGMVARNETVIDYDTDLVKYYVIEDGQKVSKGGTLAELYNNSEQININNQIKELQKNIDNIEQTMAYNSTEAVDLNLLSNKVYTALSDYVNSFAAGNFSGANEVSAELLSTINIRQAATGETVDFSSTLAVLSDRMAKLQASKATAQGAITTDRSGYFVSQVDGFEKTLSVENVLKMLPDDFGQIKAEKLSQTAIGKIVEDYKWYIVSLITIDKSARFSVGKTVTLKTNLREMPQLKAIVRAVNKGKTGNEAVLVLECDGMNNYISSARNISVTVVTENYDGLMVNANAIRNIDGKHGVFVVSGMQASFVKVKILKYTDDYAICEMQTDDTKALRLYDEVIVKGKNMYDGKIIK
ncbi:MAG: hypothetical protein J6I80_05490 [Clostridia bacterium]|nr:hypothetical protein [Clostridia bacterium]